MQVYVYFKIKDPDDLTTSASRFGDLAYIYPIVDSTGSKHHQGKLTLDSFRPIVMDLNIPCGNDFLDLKQGCPTCQWNNPALCDYRKFQRATWSTGSVLTPPKPIRKSRYKLATIKLKRLFGNKPETDIDKMTEVYKKARFAIAENNISLKSELIDTIITTTKVIR